jgi:hypothetical protein
VPKEGKRVEQAFQACVKDHQRITGLQPPRYVLGSNQGTTFSRATSLRRSEPQLGSEADAANT